VVIVVYHCQLASVWMVIKIKVIRLRRWQCRCKGCLSTTTPRMVCHVACYIRPTSSISLSTAHTAASTVTSWTPKSSCGYVTMMSPTYIHVPHGPLQSTYIHVPYGPLLSLSLSLKRGCYRLDIYQQLTN
jgi:hypothetical protein